MDEPNGLCEHASLMRTTCAVCADERIAELEGLLDQYRVGDEEAFAEKDRRIAELEAQLSDVTHDIDLLIEARQYWRSRMGLKVTDDVVIENAELRAEIERLKSELAAHNATYHTPDIESLRASYAATMKELTDEIERLKAQHEDA